MGIISGAVQGSIPRTLRDFISLVDQKNNENTKKTAKSFQVQFKVFKLKYAEKETSKAEIRRAIKSLKNGKAAGEDMITAELLKADLEFTIDRVKELIDTMIWSLEKVPRKWKRGLIIKIPKKGNLRECKNLALGDR